MGMCDECSQNGSLKKLLKIARKRQRIAAMSRERITLPKVSGYEELQIADRAHFVIYKIYQNQFVFPIRHLNNFFIQERSDLFEEEFGPMSLPCDAMFMGDIE